MLSVATTTCLDTLLAVLASAQLAIQTKDQTPLTPEMSVQSCIDLADQQYCDAHACHAL